MRVSLMGASLPSTSAATVGNKPDESCRAEAASERLGKKVAIACLSAAIESFIAARDWSRAQLAEDICGMTESNFSKTANGGYGDFWALVYKLPADIRADFFERLHESERVDPAHVAEQLILVALQLVRVAGIDLPTRLQMARAGIDQQQRKRA